VTATVGLHGDEWTINLRPLPFFVNSWWRGCFYWQFVIPEERDRLLWPLGDGWKKRWASDSSIDRKLDFRLSNGRCIPIRYCNPLIVIPYRYRECRTGLCDYRIYARAMERMASDGACARCLGVRRRSLQLA
jgi:hypothetical protein